MTKTKKATKPRGKQIGGERYTKKSFAAKWSEITAKQARNLTIDEVHFIKESLLATDKYCKLAENPNTRLTIKPKQFMKFTVRGVIIISPNSKTEIWVGKEDIVNRIFPKKIKTESFEVNNSSLVSRAFRQLIQEEISEKKHILLRKVMMSKNIPCPLSGELLHLCEGGTELDHIYPFSQMVLDFFREEGLIVENIQVRINGTKYLICDKTIAQKWLQYHLKNAKLQLACKKANREKSNKW